MLVFTAVHREREAGRLGELSQARHDAVDLERASATWSTSSFTSYQLGGGMVIFR